MKNAIEEIKRILPEKADTLHDDIKYVDLVKEIKFIINKISKNENQCPT